MVVYSTQRPASFSVLKHLIPKLPSSTPKLIVAMITTKSDDQKWLVEGQELASKWEKTLFVSNDGEDLPSMCDVCVCVCVLFISHQGN